MRDEEVKALRDQGYTLQSIGDRFGVTRERIRQILVAHYGTADRDSRFVSRNKAARLTGVARKTLTRLEKKGVVKPVCCSGHRLYNPTDIAKVVRWRQERERERTAVRLVCESCGKEFYRPLGLVRPESPGRFCSKSCHGVWLGKHHGFVAHPEHSAGGRNRKHDYESIRRLREETGWGAVRIGRELGIPEPTVTGILKSLFGKPLPRSAVGHHPRKSTPVTRASTREAKA